MNISAQAKDVINISAQAKDVITRARVKLLSSHPFYGYIACRLKLRECVNGVMPGTDQPLPTMATDGVHLFYNPEFTASLSKQQAMGAIAHEVEHVYLKHIPRAMEMHVPDNAWHIAQIAMDMAINPHLKDGGFELIEGAVFPEQQYWKESFEQHYKRLMQSAQRINISLTGKGKGSCSGSQPLKGPSGEALSPTERAQIENDIQMTVMNAGEFARSKGKLPADIERLLGEMRKPKVMWQDVLRRFMHSAAKNDYRMLPPNRRYIWQNMYLPSLRSETVGDVLLVIDGSGSTFHIFPQFIREFASILNDVRPERLHVLVWDTRCSWQGEFDGSSDESYETLSQIQYGAGGGSVFTDTFEYFERETGITPQVAIVLTDMEIYFPEDPGYPVMWVATEDIAGPFGETVRIEVD